MRRDRRRHRRRADMNNIGRHYRRNHRGRGRRGNRRGNHGRRAGRQGQRRIRQRSQHANLIEKQGAVIGRQDFRHNFDLRKQVSEAADGLFRELRGRLPREIGGRGFGDARRGGTIVGGRTGVGGDRNQIGQTFGIAEPNVNAARPRLQVNARIGLVFLQPGVQQGAQILLRPQPMPLRTQRVTRRNANLNVGKVGGRLLRDVQPAQRTVAVRQTPVHLELPLRVGLLLVKIIHAQHHAKSVIQSFIRILRGARRGSGQTVLHNFPHIRQ